MNASKCILAGVLALAVVTAAAATAAADGEKRATPCAEEEAALLKKPEAATVNNIDAAALDLENHMNALAETPMTTVRVTSDHVAYTAANVRARLAAWQRECLSASSSHASAAAAVRKQER